jgi:DNA-binding CsgD family transcriptional regulator
MLLRLLLRLLLGLLGLLGMLLGLLGLGLRMLLGLLGLLRLLLGLLGMLGLGLRMLLRLLLGMLGLLGLLLGNQFLNLDMDLLQRNKRRYEMTKIRQSKYKDYWAYGEAHFKHTEDGKLLEPILANPDALSEDDAIIWKARKYSETVDIQIKGLFLKGVYRLLAPKEKEVFKYLSLGMTQEKIADILNVSRERVKNIVKIIRDKGEKHRTKKHHYGDIV